MMNRLLLAAHDARQDETLIRLFQSGDEFRLTRAAAPDALSPAELTRNAHSLGFREAVRVPPATPIDEQKESLAETKQQPVQISVRETKTPDLAVTRPDPVKKLVKPVVDQGPVKSNLPNERPRVVGDGEKRVASLSVKSF